jgi:hypothetical protein
MQEPWSLTIEHDAEARPTCREPVLANWWMTDMASVQGILLPRAEGSTD